MSSSTRGWILDGCLMSFQSMSPLNAIAAVKVKSNIIRLSPDSFHYKWFADYQGLFAKSHLIMRFSFANPIPNNSGLRPNTKIPKQKEYIGWEVLWVNLAGWPRGPPFNGIWVENFQFISEFANKFVGWKTFPCLFFRSEYNQGN